MYLILCCSYLNHSLRFCWGKKEEKKKSHIKSQSQYFGKKSQLDYFPKSFSPTSKQPPPWIMWILSPRKLTGRPRRPKERPWLPVAAWLVEAGLFSVMRGAPVGVSGDGCRGSSAEACGPGRPGARR